MKVLRTTTDAQTIDIIPRFYAEAGVIYLMDKQTKETYTLDAEFNRGTNYLSLTSNFALKEGRRYSFVVSSLSTEVTERMREFNGVSTGMDCVETYLRQNSLSDNIIYRDTILCTDTSDLDRYDVQEGRYLVNESESKKYIIKDE